MGSIIAKSYHSGQAGHNGGGGRLRGVGKRQTSKDLIQGVKDLKIRGVEDLKIRGVEDIMAELVLEHPEWRCKGGSESGVSGKRIIIYQNVSFRTYDWYWQRKGAS